MEEKETIVKEIIGDIVIAAVSIYLLNKFLADVLPLILDYGITMVDMID